MRRPDRCRTPVAYPIPELVSSPQRKGHGRRRKPTDLPRRLKLIDLSDVEKVHSCCGTTEVRIGRTTSERVDYTGFVHADA